MAVALYLPLLHEKQASPPADAEYFPGTHCMHNEAPELGETEPASHKAQLLCPVVSVNLPGLHAVGVVERS